MRARTLLVRSLRHYWRTNLAVIAGVAIAVAVLSGALIVGVSVRASLRDLVLDRLGRTDHAVFASGFFREALSETFEHAAPLVVLDGFVTAQGTGRRASRVQVYAVDGRFWRFHGMDRTPELSGNDALLSESLASEIGAVPSDSIVLRIENASAIPTESLHGRKDDVGRTVRLTVRDVLGREQLGEFSLKPQQGTVRALFMPLSRMQALLEHSGRVNAILVAGTDKSTTERRLAAGVQLDDFGLRLRALDDRGVISLESDSTILSDAFRAAATDAAERRGMRVIPVLTYLANTIRRDGRQIPYSVITAADLSTLGLGDSKSDPNGIVLNSWAATDLGAAVGDPIAIDYYVWETEGRLSTRTADFRVSAIAPMAGAAVDRNLVPEYPGITDTDRVADWNPPFPIDLRRVRPIDEEYWKRHRATPKAFIPIERGQQLWNSRHGAVTALRIVAGPNVPISQVRDEYEKTLRDRLDPLAMHFSVYDVRAQSLAASTGATDFGEYFTYFSTFLVVAALLLGGLFFKLGIEQRLQEIGLLQALGLTPAAIRRLFVSEGLIVSILGGLIGMAGAAAYAAVIMQGLRTWWVDAVGTTALRLHVAPMPLFAGAVAVVLIAMVAIWWSLRSLASASTRSLLKGSDPLFTKNESPRLRLVAMASGGLAVLLLVGTAAGLTGRVAGFFGAGGLILLSSLCFAAVWLRKGRRRALGGHGLHALVRIGWRNTAYRPARSVLCIALIAFATFVIVAVEAFKRGDAGSLERNAGSGGFPLLLETLLPIVHDLNDADGRDVINLPAQLPGVRFERFRVRPGDDTSCLNLYQPKNPRILGATPDFITSGRFAFQSSLAESPEETANPWLLLNRKFEDGAIPVITDANSMTYVLHMKLGDDIVVPGSRARPTRLRLVGALSDSIFQSELLMAEELFVQRFPEWEGYRLFLIDAPEPQAAEISAMLESRLADFGADAAMTAERLAGFHRVEYTYLSTFQMLGGLGLLVGTLGLAAVLLRNVLERRRELALLRAFGYRKADFLAIVVAENVALVVAGLVVGTMSALVAITPTLLDRGGRLPATTVAILLLGVLLTGLLASIGATVAALRSPLLSALRTE
jgi:ABC-type lipoprotein release transport system permease subunit